MKRVVLVVQQLPAPSVCPHFADLLKRGAEAWRAEVARARGKS